jgi:DNA invertase Pin-like site-specific DNA recombinase
VFIDAGISGSTPLGRRPQGAALLAALRPGDTAVIAKLDRGFRSALDALQTIQNFKHKGFGLWALDLGDCTGNGVSQLILTVLSAVAEFERSRISERISDAKAALRRQGKHQGGSRPFGFAFGSTNGHGRARVLVPDPAEQQAIVDIAAMRSAGESLMAIRDTMRKRGHWISHNLVASICARMS